MANVTYVEDENIVLSPVELVTAEEIMKCDVQWQEQCLRRWESERMKETIKNDAYL